MTNKHNAVVDLHTNNQQELNPWIMQLILTLRVLTYRYYNQR